LDSDKKICTPHSTMLGEIVSVSQRICIEFGVAFCKYGFTINSTENNNDNDEIIVRTFFIKTPPPKG